MIKMIIAELPTQSTRMIPVRGRSGRAHALLTRDRAESARPRRRRHESVVPGGSEVRILRPSEIARHATVRASVALMLRSMEARKCRARAA